MGQKPDLGWHVISGEDLMRMLRRVEEGEKPDIVYLEWYANAEREDYRDPGTAGQP